MKNLFCNPSGGQNLRPLPPPRGWEPCDVLVNIQGVSGTQHPQHGPVIFLDPWGLTGRSPDWRQVWTFDRPMLDLAFALEKAMPVHMDPANVHAGTPTQPQHLLINCGPEEAYLADGNTNGGGPKSGSALTAWRKQIKHIVGAVLARAAELRPDVLTAWAGLPPALAPGAGWYCHFPFIRRATWVEDSQDTVADLCNWSDQTPRPVYCGLRTYFGHDGADVAEPGLWRRKSHCAKAARCGLLLWNDGPFAPGWLEAVAMTQIGAMPPEIH